jgi:hypothetical protein
MRVAAFSLGRFRHFARGVLMDIGLSKSRESPARHHRRLLPEVSSRDVPASQSSLEGAIRAAHDALIDPQRDAFIARLTKDLKAAVSTGRFRKRDIGCVH